MSRVAPVTSNRTRGGILAAALSLVLALSFLLVPSAAHAVTDEPAPVDETLSYWGAPSGTDQTTAGDQEASLLDLWKFYSGNDPRTTDRSLTTEDIRDVLGFGLSLKKLYAAEGNWDAVKGGATWVYSFGHHNVPRFTSKQAAVYIKAFKGQATNAVKSTLDDKIDALKAAKGTAPSENQDRIQAVIDALSQAKADPSFDPMAEDMLSMLEAANALIRDNTATPDVPGYQAADPKADAANRLKAEADALRALLDANPVTSLNLSDQERTSAQQALSKAEAALDDLDAWSAESLDELATQTGQATDSATQAIASRRKQALDALAALRSDADGIVNDSTIAEELREPVTADNRNADLYALHPEDYSVSMINALREKTAADIAAARKGAAEAALDAVIAKLQELVDNNGTDTQNLTPEELADAQKALDTAKQVKADAADTSTEKLTAAVTEAEGAHSAGTKAADANRAAARESLNTLISEASTLASDVNLPEDDARALKEAITAARTFAGKAGVTVKELNDAQDALAASVAAAKEARDNAMKNAALSDLNAQIGALEGVLADNPEDSKNLTDEQRQHVQDVLDAAKATRDDAAQKSLQDLKDATAAARDAVTTATSQVSANKQVAASALANQIANAAAVAALDAVTEEERNDLNAAIREAERVRASDPVTVDALDSAADGLRAAKDTAIKQIKERAKAALDHAVSTLATALETNSEDTENLTAEQRQSANELLATLRGKIDTVDDPNTTFDEIAGWTTQALNGTTTVNQQVAQNKVQPTVDLKNKIADLEQFLAAHPPTTKDLTEEERNAAETALGAAQDRLAKAQAGALTVHEIIAATKEVDSALSEATKAVDTNRVKSRATLTSTLEKAKGLLARDDLTDASREVLGAAVSSGDLGESATVALLDEVSNDLDAAIKQVAVDDLDKQIAALEQVLADNPKESENLSDSEYAALEQALADAKKTRQAAAIASTSELNEATEAAKRAVTTANAAADANRAAAKRALDNEIANAKAVASSDIPEADRKTLENAVAAAQTVSDTETSTVADLKRQLADLREVKTAAAKAGEDAKTAAKNALADAVETLTKALEDNGASSGNLTDAQRADAEQALAQAQVALANADEATTAAVLTDANAALDATAELDENVMMNKVEPTIALRDKIAEFEQYVALNSVVDKNLTDAQRADAEQALAQAREALAAAEDGTLSVTDIRAAIAEADGALQAVANTVRDNLQAAIAAYEASLAKAKELLARDDLTASSRRALTAAVDGLRSTFGGDVATLLADTKVLTDAIDAVEFVTPSGEGLAATGASLAAVPLALFLMLTGALLVRRRRQAV